MGRRLPLLTTLLAAAALPGCIGIDQTSTLQPTSMGPVRLTASVCATGSPSCTANSTTASFYEELAESGSNGVFPMQVLYAVRLPDGAAPPATLTGTRAGGGALAFTRSTGYETQLQALEPAPAGERWWGWISAVHDYSRTSQQGLGVTVEVPLPRPADGGPSPSPLRWRPVVGARMVAPGLPAGRPVYCGTSTAELYESLSEPGYPTTPTGTTTCVDSPDPSATRGFLGAPVTDFGLLGTPASAPAGSSVTLVFQAKRSGPADPATVFQLQAAGGPPGGSPKLDRTTVGLGEDAGQVVLATVGVPAGTAPGAYPVTLTATAPGKPTRTATATLTVPAGPSTPPTGTVPGGTTPAPPPPPPAVDRTAPRLTGVALTSAKLRRGRGAGALRLALGEAARVSATIERLVPGRRRAGRCSATATRGARCTLVRVAATTSRSLGAGAARVALPTRRLAVGRYRVRVHATDAAGNRATARALSLTVRR